MARNRRSHTAAALTALALCLTATACGSDGDDNEGSAGDAGGGGGGTKQVAYLMAGSANTYIQSAGDAMEKVAAANDIKITGFDGQFKLGEQTKQIQDIIASGKYDGIVVNTLDGVGIQPDLEAAIEAGIQVAMINNIVGTDLSTTEPQFDDRRCFGHAAPDPGR